MGVFSKPVMLTEGGDAKTVTFPLTNVSATAKLVRLAGKTA
jgi:hypothetical protein